MRTRFMKPVLVGTLAVVASAIVAGPAFGRVFSPNTSQNQGSPPSQHVEIPGNGVFPDLQRLRSLLTPAERRQLDAVAATARSIDRQQGSTALSQVHQPGVTSGPAALPPEVMTTPHKATASGSSGVNWNDAGVGIGIALAIAGGLVILAIVGIRRDKATPAPA